MAVVEEANPNIYEGKKWAESETDEVMLDAVQTQFDDAGLLRSTMINQTVPWSLELLHKRYKPMTPMRGIQLMSGSARSTP